MNDFQLTLRVILFSLIAFTFSCQSSKKDRDSAILMAEQVATQLDVITGALDSAKNYKTANEAGETMDLAGAEIVKIYHHNQGLKTDHAQAEQVSKIIKKSSIRLEEARVNAVARFKDDIPPKLKILTALNRLSENMKLANDQDYRGPLSLKLLKADGFKPLIKEKEPHKIKQ
jgi:hypothetical protein